MDILERKLKVVKYKSIKRKGKQQTCNICCEDFESDSLVRETNCEHIFDDECLISWVKKRIEKPECPTCKTVIKL